MADDQNLENKKDQLKFDTENLSILRDQLDALKDMDGARREQINLSSQLNRMASSRLADEETLSDTLRSGRDIQKEINKASTLGAKIVNEAAISGEEISKNLLEQHKTVDLILESLEKELNIRKEIDEITGITGKIMSGMGGALGKALPFLGKMEKSFETQILALHKNKTLLTGIGGKIQAMSVGMKVVGGAIMKDMFDPMMLLQQGFKLDTQITQFEKNLGISRKEAEKLRGSMAALALSTNDVSINTNDIVSSYTELNKQFGIAASTMRGDIVLESTKLVKLTGMSAESAANFAKYANISGKDMSTITKEARAAVVAAEGEKGVRLDINKVLDQAGKIGGQISAQLGANPAKLAKAVALAKQFGMELEQVVKMGDSLLNFESSIQNELEAELLTGKQLNLEKARLAALTGDYETLTKEINKNVGDFGEFTKMNVLQQRALAAAVGMTADELSDVLLKEANLEELAQEARAGGDEDLAQQLEKRSAQEKFNDSMEKMQSILGDILIAFLPVVEMMAGLADNMWIVYTVLGLVAAVKLVGVISTVVSLATALGAASAGAATLASGLTLGIAAVAIAAGVTLIMAANSKAKNSAKVKLAEGGVVKAKPGGVNAVIGEGGQDEMVLPLSKANSMGFGGGGMDYDKLATIISNRPIKNSIQYDSFSANNSAAYGGRYSEQARHESKFV
mgnify:CR=1 FL=1|tara:strand:- start:1456 stop:3510 length:2055 start_codon:yes stop_codon:yes gene_type:complete